MKSSPLPDDVQRLIPLTPAVFFVLFSLAEGERHGYAIMQETAKLSEGKFRMGAGTLYTTIQRLLGFSLIEETEASAGDTDTRRRYYRLTGWGQSLLDLELERMRSVLRLAARRTLKPRTSE